MKLKISYQFYFNVMEMLVIPVRFELVISQIESNDPSQSNCEINIYRSLYTLFTIF
jgi:hypothetical protein